MDIRAKIGLVNKDESQFIGPGLIELLDEIRYHKSIKKAAKAMGLSYKKAHRMVNRLETNLGEQFFVRKRGGTERGGTDITPVGEIYIAEFKRLEERVKRRAAEEFGVFRKRVQKKKKKQR
jgi:molybdate transport system regulatory protein